MDDQGRHPVPRADAAGAGAGDRRRGAARAEASGARHRRRGRDGRRLLRGGMSEEMEKATHVAVVGAGFIADFHLEVLKQLPGVVVVAVVDVDRARAQALAAKHKVARVHGSIAELVAAGKPDVAHALVPPQRHAEVATELLEAGIGVFLEKPIATTRADAQRLLQLAETLRLPLGVNHNATFHPAFVAAKRRLAGRELGQLDHVFGCLSVPLRQLNTRDFSHYMFRTPRNIVFEQATHPFSQLVDLLGPVRGVTAVPGGRRELAPGIVFYDTWQLALTHERGTASLFLSFGRDFAESFVRLLGQDGSLHVDLLRGHVTRLAKTPWPDFWDQLKNAQVNARALLRQGWHHAASYVLSTLKLKGRSDLFYVGMRDAIAAFHAGLRGGPRYPCDARQGL
ncbi:MAG: Gfo/Idh/MocA family oxidoreductase, partial [Planctomycetes bacterium]|nr:Gfo/Idh/MocA family oxidoreductase [Planctomycetota bacterium]